MRLLVITLLIAVTAALLFLLFRGWDKSPSREYEEGIRITKNDPAPITQDTVPSIPVAPPVPVKELPGGVRSTDSIIPDDRFTRLEDGRSISNEGYAAARSLHRAGFTVEDDLGHLESVFGLYTWAFQELPEGGENYEIMAALTGNNPHKVVFFPPDHGSLDNQGNLLDRWGTPYFFHKVSDQVIDVVSPGPDRRLWTNDDVGMGLTEDYTGKYDTAASD